MWMGSCGGGGDGRTPAGKHLSHTMPERADSSSSQMSLQRPRTRGTTPGSLYQFQSSQSRYVVGGAKKMRNAASLSLYIYVVFVMYSFSMIFSIIWNQAKTEPLNSTGKYPNILILGKNCLIFFLLCLSFGGSGQPLETAKLINTIFFTIHMRWNEAHLVFKFF